MTSMKSIWINYSNELFSLITMITLIRRDLIDFMTLNLTHLSWC